MNKYLTFSCAFLSAFIWIWHGCTGTSYPQGERLYQFYCANCHMLDGSGLNDLYPAMESSAYLSVKKAELACLILNGAKGTNVKTVDMPPVKGLTEAEMHNLVNYIITTWGNDKGVPVNELRIGLESCD